MQELYELIQQLDWFLTPVTNAAVFLFTTARGLVLLGIILFLYFIASYAGKLRQRRLQHMAARSSYERGRVPGAEKITLFVGHTSQVLFHIITKLPVVLGALLIVLFISTATNAITNMHEYVENRKEIKALQTTLQHLDQDYKVAEIEITEVDYSQLPDVYTSLSIQYYDYAGLGLREDKQTLTVKGRDIYIDAMVLNFGYSEIAAGGVQNIAVPYRIFSNQVAQTQAQTLEVMDEEGVPFIFHRKEAAIYGITPETYNEKLAEIATFFKDKEKARKAGVRSVYGNAVHRLVRAGQKFELRMEQTGGLTLNIIQGL